MSRPDPIALEIAASFLSGSWRVEAMVARARDSLGQAERRPDWLAALARSARERHPDGPPLDARDELARFLAGQPQFGRAARSARVVHPALAPAEMRATRFAVPPLATEGELAAWLGVRPRVLDWLADRRGLERWVDQRRLERYSYRWISKRSGGARLLEAPRGRLRSAQRRILDQILSHVPPHDAAHGFRCGRSPVTAARPHVGQAVVLRVDIEEFFNSITAARIRAVFRTAGYPEHVAWALAGLCTNRSPRAMLSAVSFHTRSRLVTPHLPQGAPTSPALANLCAFRLDARLTGLAAAAGARYTRYADDLAFSGDLSLARGMIRFAAMVEAIAADEGFRLNARKTRVLRAGVRQELAGVVVNVRPTIRRRDFDRLKAILTNCVRHGPSSQDRGEHRDLRAHLRGTVAWVEGIDSLRGARLRALFDRIAWETGG
jgi:hypothetical protein